MGQNESIPGKPNGSPRKHQTAMVRPESAQEPAEVSKKEEKKEEERLPPEKKDDNILPVAKSAKEPVERKKEKKPEEKRLPPEKKNANAKKADVVKKKEERKDEEGLPPVKKTRSVPSTKIKKVEEKQSIREEKSEEKDNQNEVPPCPSNEKKAEKKEETEKKSSGRHGKWEYVPVAAEPKYPKLTTKGDKRSRELAKLYTSTVDSQHPLTKAPEEWLAGSEFDLNLQLSMSDRIKNNRRATRSDSLESIAKAEAKERRKATKRKANSSRKRDPSTKSMERGASMSRSHTPIDQDGVSLYSSKGSEMGDEEEHSGSMDLALLEQMCTPFDPRVEEMKQMMKGGTGHGLADEEQAIIPAMLPDPLAAMVSSGSYSISFVNPQPPPFPEDFLEEMKGEMDETGEGLFPPSAFNSVRDRRLPPPDLLEQLRYRYNTTGAQYKEQLLVIRLPQGVSMEELMSVLETERSEMWLVPIRRPQADSEGYVALVFTHEEQANLMLQHSPIVVGSTFLPIERPGAIHVGVDGLHMSEDYLREVIGREVGPILHLQKGNTGVMVLLPSVDTASMLIRQSVVGPLGISSPQYVRVEQEWQWPIIDRNWAIELGMK